MYCFNCFDCTFCNYEMVGFCDKLYFYCFPEYLYLWNPKKLSRVPYFKFCLVDDHKLWLKLPTKNMKISA